MRDGLPSSPGGEAARKTERPLMERATKKEQADFTRYIHDRAFELLDELNSITKTEKLPEEAAPVIARKIRFVVATCMRRVAEEVVREAERREARDRKVFERDQERPPKEHEPSTVAKLLHLSRLDVDLDRMRVERVIDVTGFKRKSD